MTISCELVKQLLLGAGLLATFAAAAGAQPAATFYVATNGNDAWSGQLAAPNEDHSNGPFATPGRAQAAVRRFLQQHPGYKFPVTVLLRGGTYFLEQPLVFTPADSGTAAAPVVFAAYGKEQPLLSGGVWLQGWKRGKDGWWRVQLPGATGGAWSFSQLFVNNGRRYRPRLPQSGYYTIDDALPPSPRAKDQGFDRFRFRAGDLRPDWHDLHDVEVLAFQTWTMARMRVDTVDAQDRAVTFTGHTLSKEGYQALPRGNRYLVENVREGMGKPGDFYLDRLTGEVAYVPYPGENPATAVVIAPRLDHLLELRGDVKGRKWVQHLTFRGIGFAHTNWVTPPEGNVYWQAEANLGGAVTATGARDCAFERCRVEHVGTYGIELGAGCKRCIVDGCDLTDLGAGGVKIGTMTISQDEEEVASDNTVRGCLIAHGGRMHPAGIGVWIGQSHHDTVQNNEIADFYYTGVSVGWTWGYGASLAHDDLIAYNHIHQIGQGVLSDLGGIYTLGVRTGCVLRGNRIHDVESFSYGGWGIYPDEGSSNLLVEDNVVYRCKSALFHQHYGKENVVRNNIFALGREFQVMRTRAEPHLSFTFEHNLFYWTEGKLLGSNWSGDNYKLDYNLYGNQSGQPLSFAGMTLEQWQAKGQDTHSAVADPRFMDPMRGDFRLRKDSPAPQVGFRPFDLTQAGAPGKRVTGVPAAFPTAGEYASETPTRSAPLSFRTK